MAKNNRLGRAIRDKRDALGMTQGALAKSARTTNVTVCRIEKGKQIPDRPLAARLSRALGIDVDSLIGGAA
jgi:transcriptional regulator with XRE-family HTH domain